MARRRSFYTKVIQKLRRDAGSAWTKDYITSMRDIVNARMSKRARGTSTQLVGKQLMGCLQQEAFARLLDDESFTTRGMSLPDPPLYPGLMAAWEALPTTVEIDETLLAQMKSVENDESENPSFASASLDIIRELFPACLLFDIRGLSKELYGIRLDAMVVYPSYDADCGYELLLIMAFDLRYGLFEPLCSKIVLDGATLGEAVDFTIEERLRLEKRCMSETDHGMHDIIFSPLEDDETIMRIAALTLAMMVSDESIVERSMRGQGTHLHVRKRMESEVSQNASPTPSDDPSPATNDDEQPSVDVHDQAERRSKPSDAPAEACDLADEACSPTDDKANSSLETELFKEIARLEHELSAERSKASSLAYHLKQSRDALAEAQKISAANVGRATILESLELPESPAEALELAIQAFPDRLVVLDSARKAAQEFVRGDTAEVWAVLRSMATVLHPMVFNRHGSNIVYAFQAQTGFELTLREMKLIKRTSDTARLRTVTYRGQQHSATAHVKGRGRGRGETLRVHFFADYDEQKLVISHCGEHLTTYDTPSL